MFSLIFDVSDNIREGHEVGFSGNFDNKSQINNELPSVILKLNIKCSDSHQLVIDDVFIDKLFSNSNN